MVPFPVPPDGSLWDSRSCETSTVVIRAKSPIRSRGNTGGMCALAIGLILALHTPSWLVLVFYKEDIVRMITTTDDSIINNTDDRTTSASTVIFRFLMRWILEFTPWFANAMLSLFLGVLFLYIGFATMEVPNAKSR